MCCFTQEKFDITLFYGQPSLHLFIPLIFNDILLRAVRKTKLKEYFIIEWWNNFQFFFTCSDLGKDLTFSSMCKKKKKISFSRIEVYDVRVTTIHKNILTFIKLISIFSSYIILNNLRLNIFAISFSLHLEVYKCYFF